LNLSELAARCLGTLIQISSKQNWTSNYGDSCCEVILKESRGSLSRHTSVLDFLKSSSGTPASPSVLLETGDDDDDDDEADAPPSYSSSS